MTSFRMTALAVVATLAALMLGASGAAAQTANPAGLKQTVPLTGSNGFKGTFTVDRFAQRAGKTVALGTVKGRLRGRNVTRSNVALPATVTRKAAAATPAAPAVPVPAVPAVPVPAVPGQATSRQLIPPTPNACQILNLVLGPIDLNLLGLRVRTNQINVLIEGVPGAGNLVGNLLCSITGLLDPGRITGGQLVQLLNAILALVPRQ